jgi:hypothetical protein
MYEFQENGGFATLRFGVLQGTLRILVSVSFDLMSGTAEGKEGRARVKEERGGREGRWEDEGKVLERGGKEGRREERGSGG